MSLTIYPHNSPKGIIELVEKREYDSMNLLAHELATERDELARAFAHLSTQLANITFDPVTPMLFACNVANHVDDLRVDFNAHQDAVKRMEEVGMIELDEVLQSQETYGASLMAVRTRLIQAAKGELK